MRAKTPVRLGGGGRRTGISAPEIRFFERFHRDFIRVDFFVKFFKIFPRKHDKVVILIKKLNVDF